MTLSFGWGEPVVVRISDDGGSEHVEQPMPKHRSAWTLAAAGHPVTVRARVAANFMERCDDAVGGSGTHDPAPGIGLGRTLTTALFGHDLSTTFWVPDAAKNEIGLLEALHRRGVANRTHILVQSRPLPELQRNYSTSTGQNIDLSHPLFRLSKTALVVQNLDERLGESAGTPSTGILQIPARGFQAAVRANLAALQTEDYYLVRYRDYSAWAVRTYASLARRDAAFGPRYVEQCFAVHIGREPGELIPLTEAQFLFGVELLQRELLNELAPGEQGGAAGSVGDPRLYTTQQRALDYAALNADQFRSLGVVLGDGMRPVGVEGEERRRAEEAARLAAHLAAATAREAADETPAWYDWSPGAIRRRVRRRLRGCYTVLGRWIVGGAVWCACGVVALHLVGAGPWLRRQLPFAAGREVGRTTRPGRRREGGYYYDAHGDYDAPPPFQRRGFFRSVWMGPKDALDYLLAPSNWPG